MRRRQPRTVSSVAETPATSGDARLSSSVQRDSIDTLFSVAYEELRRLASAIRRSDPSATISPTGLVNEAWMKLIRSPALRFTSRLHFKRVAARAMRQVLVEAARRRQASKRGGEANLVTFTESLGGATTWGAELLALDDALDALARLSPRQAQMVESRFFGGLEIPEIAELLGVSEATVLRDWRATKAWLARELRRQRPDDPDLTLSE
jgi:RNA polymerase sigma factor (TIGR02999 family)